MTKPVIHIPTPSARGSSVEAFEARADRLRAEGYEVAPVPIDGREHYVSKLRGPNTKRPCPACSPPA